MESNYKIALVLPYYGQFPSYFSLFLKSVELNPDFDLLLVTDLSCGNYSIPANVHVVDMSFDEVKQRVWKRIDSRFPLDEVYKLCDCRPLYGLIFAEELQGYDFWGHCDADILFGNLRRFVGDELLAMYDKLFTHGHFVLYRNCDRVNRLALEYRSAPCGLDFAMSSKLACYFDEVGMANVAKIAGISVYQNPSFADITPKCDALMLAPICAAKNQSVQHFFWRNGRVVREVAAGDNTDEFMYIHLQKRKMSVHISPHSANWEITSHAFYDEGCVPRKIPGALRMRLSQEIGFQISRLKRFSPERVRLSAAIKSIRASL